MSMHPVAPHSVSRPYTSALLLRSPLSAREGRLLEPASASGSHLRVEDIREWDRFIELEREWNALVAAADNQIFYRHEFIRLWIKHFLGDGRLRLLALRNAKGGLEALLPLIERRSTIYGVPVRELASATNDHSYRFDLVARDPPLAAAVFFDYLQNDPGWDVLRLSDIPEGGKAYCLSHAAERLGYPSGIWPSFSSPYAVLPKSHVELLAQLDSKFKANLRRRRKRLEERGKIGLEQVKGGANLAWHLEQGLALERKGWKGRRGTAIAQDRSTLGFYSELAQAAARFGVLSLWFLRLNGQAIGFQYGLEYANRYLLLKPAYDESLKDCSPGQLLNEAVFANCVHCGFSEFDFLGHDMEWKRDWTDRVRPHHWLFIFRNTAKGRALRAAKFDWAPAAKQWMTRWKP